MDTKNGAIGIKTENIFPIIKKFLYSDHEIFLREIISNAVDATQKLKSLQSIDSVGEIGDTTIKVSIDKENRTITVSDKGIGMTMEEVDKYINQIAFSSAEEFVNEFKTKSQAELNSIIGHFGLGFYSVFMVSDRVDIITKSYKKSKAVKWSCDGSPNYTMEYTDKKERGTDIVLHIDKENDEFLDDYKIESLLNKYCKFLPIPIQFGTKKINKETDKKDDDGNTITEEVEVPKIINNTNPIWKSKPTDLTDKDYMDFYKELYPYVMNDPLFYIHLNIDYPFNLTGILYFPKIDRTLIQKDKIQLYSNQVFVTDSVEGIVPEFLTLLHGVIDSPDIPLNVSRSYLQHDQVVKKISGYITKKVSDKLLDIFNKDRDTFQRKWDDLKIFIEYGMLSDDKFYERAIKFALFKNVNNEYYTFDEYNTKVGDTQKNKEGKTIFLYTSNYDDQYNYVKQATSKGYDVLIMNSVVYTHYINMLEQKIENIKFARVDSDVIDNIIDINDYDIPSKISDEQKESLKEKIMKNIDNSKYRLVMKNMSIGDPPFVIVQNEFMSRVNDMRNISGENKVDNYDIIVNTNNDIILKILNEDNEDKRDNLIKQVYDIARLSKNLLRGEDLTNFTKRSLSVISDQ